MPATPEISVIVPAYKSEASLRPLVLRLRSVLDSLSVGYEIVMVCDGSPDRSWDVISELVGELEMVRGLNLRRNFGQHNALLAGIRAARGNVIVTIDDDLQHPPEEIPKLLESLDRGFDVVYGFPDRLPHSLFRNVFSWFTKVALQEAMGAETARHASAFRAFRTPLRDAFAHYRGAYVSIDVLLTWATQRFSWVEVQHNPREIGESGYTLSKLATHALTMITGFSTLPLRLASVLGLVFTLFGFVVLALVLGRYFLEGGAVPGFPFLASTIALFAGAQLFALGIIGEYLARVHIRSLGRPAYVVADVVGGMFEPAEMASMKETRVQEPTGPLR